MVALLPPERTVEIMIWNEEYYLSDKWQNLRSLIFERGKRKCEKCLKRNMKHVHHLTYERFGDELLEDLQGVCIQCHEEYHPEKILRNKWKVITDIAKLLNLSIFELRRKFKELGLIESKSCGWDYSGYKMIRKFEDLPSDFAWNGDFVKKKQGAKAGRKGTKVWNWAKLRPLFEGVNVK